MKFVMVDVDGKGVAGLADPESDRLQLLDQLLPAGADMTSLIEHFDEIKHQISINGDSRRLSEARLKAPIRPRRNIFCVGKNYRTHAQEFARSGFDSTATNPLDAVPTDPIIFTKTPETVIGTGERIAYPTGVSDCVDYEAELGVIIGRGGRGISRATAYDHVWGYTIINDVTARDLQARHKQWFLGKSIDTFCPMGPWIVTSNEIDPNNLSIRCWVNDDLRQNANTRDLIFDIPTLIATISQGTALRPGDVIATGTPEGVGIGFSPPRYLQPGDQISIEITGIGRLVNMIS